VRVEGKSLLKIKELLLKVKKLLMSRRPFVQIVKDSEVTRIIQLNQGEQLFEIQIQVFLVDLYFPKDIVGCSRLLLSYEFENGWFGWSLAKLDKSDKKCDAIKKFSSTRKKIISGETVIDDFLKETYFYVSNSKMVYFILIAPTCIYFKEFTQCYCTFAQGIQMLLTHFEEQFDNIKEGRYINQPKKIPIGGEVDRRFFYRPTGRKGRNIFGEFVGAQITDVTYHNSLWQIQLESTENRQTTLILDEHFKLLNVLGDGAKGQDD